jgi:hypothetical protein
MRGLEENEPHHRPYRQAHHRQRHRRRLLRNDSGSRHRRGDRHPGRGRYDRQPSRQHTLGLSRKHALELMIEMPYSDRIVRVAGTDPPYRALTAAGDRDDAATLARLGSALFTMASAHPAAGARGLDEIAAAMARMRWAGSRMTRLTRPSAARSRLL